MKKITVIDTSICTKNMGDQIIMKSVMAELGNLFPGAFFMHIPSHDYIASESYKLIDQSDLVIVGGTNLLSSNMDSYNQWKIGKPDMKKLSNVVLLGVGWWQYQESPNRFTGKLLRQVLSDSIPHSVRDRYTQFKLREIGMANVINTSCPTTWTLTPDHCAAIPKEKGAEVVMTLTDYNRDPDRDKYLWEILRRAYEKVYFWIQGMGDYEYARDLFGDQVEYVDPTLQAFEDVLSESTSRDYVGTRLHAGVYALKHGRRSIIVSVDNRATEISNDLGLPIVERNELSKLKEMNVSSLETKLELPQADIDQWRNSVSAAVG